MGKPVWCILLLQWVEWLLACAVAAASAHSSSFTYVTTTTIILLLAIGLLIDGGRNWRMDGRGIGKGCWWHVCRGRGWGSVSYRGHGGWLCHWELGHCGSCMRGRPPAAGWLPVQPWQFGGLRSWLTYCH